MRIAFLATGPFALPSLRSAAANHTIVRVISQPDRPAGRGRAITPTPVHALAVELNLSHVQTADINAASFADTFADPEIAVVMDFGQKISGEVLRRLPRGCINIHGSLLPAYRGAAPFQRAILNGERETGVTCFQLDEKWDAGAIYGTRSTPIGPTETADELHDRLAELGGELLIATLADIEAGRATAIAQDASRASRAPKLARSDSFISLAQPAEVLVRQIHGLWSWPAATCEFVSQSGKRERLLLKRAQLIDPASAATDATPAGAFLADRSVQASPGRFRLLEVQPAGGKVMPFDAFANGRRVLPLDRLVRVEPT